MRTIKNIDSAALCVLRDEIETRLASIAGVDIKVGRGTYGDTYGTLKLEITVAGGQSKEAAAFLQKAAYAWSEFEAEDLESDFQYGKFTYKITGLNTRARKRPILAVRDGKTYLFTEAQVLKALGRKETV